ncbi:hypothetical protein T4B_9625 [Trichinella pseudospiralis]|uniref:Uncharacterized protein n=1 Tax=Trichinella pseudospiralis TaxID=6337 RepID=A0A0V1JBU3_TRIPS|nr:hypothetical protein T4B_9625 [Trichinella pseudospiralis]
MTVYDKCTFLEVAINYCKSLQFAIRALFNSDGFLGQCYPRPRVMCFTPSFSIVMTKVLCLFF